MIATQDTLHFKHTQEQTKKERMEMRVVGPPPYEESPHMSPAYRRPKKKLLALSSRSREGEDKIPVLYRHAMDFDWENVESGIRLHPEQARYVHDDGTTPLHLAVMTRTGYLMEQDRRLREQQLPGSTRSSLSTTRAPLKTVEALLRAYPEAAKMLCQINSYTPLAYACLVMSRECDLDEMETLVRLILRYCPESATVFSKIGFSPVDVHIISYSQEMIGKIEEEEFSGRTSTTVLRTLLEHNPALAQVRIEGDRVGGPIEVLFRSNKSAFLEAVAADDIKKSSHRERPRTNSTWGDGGQSVRMQVSTWWVWRWIILILKYGTLKNKKKGARFLALHAAAGLVGCPLPVITLAMHAFPKQVRLADEMNGDSGNLPLHHVCSWACELDHTSTDPVVSSRKGMAIAALLHDYPDAARVENRNGELPLALAVTSGTTWDIGVRKLVRAFPDAVALPSPTTGLFPFMTAAVAAGGSSTKKRDLPHVSKRSLKTHLRNKAKQDLQSVRTIYGLLRANPRALIGCVVEGGTSWTANFPNMNDSSLWASSPLQDIAYLKLGG